MEREPTAVGKDERLWGALAHLSGFCFLALPFFGGVLAALAIWLVKGRGSAYVEQQAREALNFQITVALATVIGIALMYVLIGVFLLLIVALADLGCMLRGALKSRQGIVHIYPYSLRLVKMRT